MWLIITLYLEKLGKIIAVSGTPKNVLSKEEGKARSELNSREMGYIGENTTLTFAKEKGAISVVYLSPLSEHGR